MPAYLLQAQHYKNVTKPNFRENLYSNIHTNYAGVYLILTVGRLFYFIR